MTFFTQRRQQAMAWAQIATGLGILTFWLLFFTIGLAPANASACYFVFEHAFPLPDTTLALGLLAAGALQLRGHALGQALSLACAGGLIFLGLVDFSFNLQNGIYIGGLADGLAAAAINLWCVAFGIALIVLQGAALQAGAAGGLAVVSAAPRDS